MFFLLIIWLLNTKELSKVKNDLKIVAEDFNKERASIEEELEQEKLTNKNLQVRFSSVLTLAFICFL